MNFGSSSKKIILLACCCLGSTALVFALYFVSNKINRDPNGFIRLFKPDLLKPQRMLDLEYNSYYIAGAGNDSFYLGNYTAPLQLLVTDKEIRNKKYRPIYLPKPSPVFKDQLVSYVYGNDLYLMEGRSPLVYTGHLSGLTVRLSRQKNPFLSAVPLSSGSSIIRTYNHSLKRSVLAKSTNDSAGLSVNPDILKTQVDGLFCTDGLFNYDPASSNLVYTYFYRNEFIRMDTNLHVLLKGKTIDTISNAQIRLAEVKSDSSLTMSAPPLMVNHHACIDPQYLYVHSGLKANNEAIETFKKYSVIDVYSLQTGQYQFSFYLPNYENEKLTNFKVLGKTLLAIHGRYMLAYAINF